MKLISAFLSAVLAGSGTDYSLQGANWKTGVCETGKRQSPINILTGSTEKKLIVQPFNLKNYKENQFDVTLEGSIKMTPKSDDITFTGGYLADEYKLAQFHLHWGDTYRGGSEHTVNGRRYFSEVHFVHFNSEKHTGLTTEALSDPNGLAVLGYFIDAGDFKESELDRIIQKAFQTYDHGNNTGTMTLDLGAMIDQQTENFYRYEGSLTTPKCNEAVLWTVFDKPLTITQKTRDLMIKTTETAAVNNNFRIAMPLNGRKVTYYHDGLDGVAASAQTLTSAGLFFATCAALALN